MIELLKVINTKLRSVTSRSYFDIAPNQAEFPYVTYRLPVSNDIDGCPNGNREDFILEIDIWDNITDTTRLETLAQQIDDEMQRTHEYNSNVAVSFYRLNRLMLPDTDQTINRRQLRYRLPTYL